MNRATAQKILGVTSTATPDELKMAYRKKAMETHPDRDGGSEGEFKEVQEAFTLLKKEDIKDDWIHEYYDKHGSVKKKYPEYAEFKENYSVTAKVPIQDAFNGCNQTINIKLEKELLPVDLDIPAGFISGSFVTVITHKNYKYSIYAEIDYKYKDHEYIVNFPNSYEPLSGDLTRKLKVPFLILITGGFIEIPIFDGTTIKIRIPAGSESGSRIKVKNKGYYSEVQQNANTRGSLYLELVPEIKTLSKFTKIEIEDIISTFKIELEK